jgi:hypothetical protein
MTRRLSAECREPPQLRFLAGTTAVRLVVAPFSVLFWLGLGLIVATNGRDLSTQLVAVPCLFLAGWLGYLAFQLWRCSMFRLANSGCYVGVSRTLVRYQDIVDIRCEHNSIYVTIRGRKPVRAVDDLINVEEVARYLWTRSKAFEGVQLSTVD